MASRVLLVESGRRGFQAPTRRIHRAITNRFATVLPTREAPLVFRDVFALPRELAPGAYELRIKVVDPDFYLGPMHLALQGATPDGSYALGRVFLFGAGIEDRD